MKWVERTPKDQYVQDDCMLVKLAKIRGIDDLDDYLNPSSKNEHDPYLLKNIEEAAKEIIKAVVAGKRICVSADCDSDGIFSTAIMVRYLRQFTSNLYVIYAQRSEGHGIEHQMKHIESETDLLIILDSSSNSVDACKELSERMQIIVLDHHEIEKENPYVLLVNPQNDSYPNKALSGAAVVYKTIRVMDDTLASETAEDFIDLVACGMYADMMNVSVPENRYLIISGMQQIKNTGLHAILAKNGVDVKSLNCDTIGYTISPLINGVARMDKIEYAIQLLLTDDASECLQLVSEMMHINEERKKIARILLERYSKHVDVSEKIIIAIDDNASKGFNGVIANDLAQRYQRPALVLRRTNGILTGSYRTYGNFKMKTFLNGFHMIGYALGHEEAGGVEFKEIHLEHLKEYVNKKIKANLFPMKQEFDIEIDAKDINFDLIREVERFDYLTGNGMPKALFMVRNLFVDERRVLGKNNDTVKISCDGIDCIKFKTTPNWANDVDILDDIDVVGSLSLNEWRKKLTPQIKVEDYYKN